MSRWGKATAMVAVMTAATTVSGCTQRAATSDSAVSSPPSRPAATAPPAATATAPPTATGPPAATAPPAATRMRTPRPRSSPAAGGYHRYINPRFGFSFDVPAGYTAGSPPEDGDGLSFTNAARTATVTGYGENNVLGQTPSGALAGLVSAYESAAGHVTYHSLDGDLIAVSGTTARGAIFYQREIVYPAVVYALVWAYPAAGQAAYDALVTHTARTFTPGPAHSG